MSCVWACVDAIKQRQSTSKNPLRQAEEKRVSRLRLYSDASQTMHPKTQGLCTRSLLLHRGAAALPPFILMWDEAR